MVYTIQSIANYFIDKAKDSNDGSLSNLKLQKIMYISYGFYITIAGEKLFNDPIQAWKHGPVIPSLYYEAKKYGSGPITDYFTKSEVVTVDSEKKNMFM